MASGKRDEKQARIARQRLQDYNAKQTVHAEQIRRRRRDNILAAIALAIVLILATVAQILYFQVGPGVPAATPTPTPTTSASTEATEQTNTGDVPSADIAEGRTWTGTMQLNGIELEISLDGALAPQGVSAFLALDEQGFYDGKSCHRLTTADDFGVLQCGSVNGDGTGDPGFQFGPIENAPADEVYPAGTIALARQSGNGFSQSSQFFIVYTDTIIPSDEAGGYTVVGQVTSGLDQLITEVVDAGTADGSEDGTPAVPTTINSVTVQ